MPPHKYARNPIWIVEDIPRRLMTSVFTRVRGDMRHVMVVHEPSDKGRPSPMACKVIE